MNKKTIKPVAFNGTVCFSTIHVIKFEIYLARNIDRTWEESSWVLPNLFSNTRSFPVITSSTGGKCFTWRTQHQGEKQVETKQELSFAAHIAFLGFPVQEPTMASRLIPNACSLAWSTLRFKCSDPHSKVLAVSGRLLS